MSDNGKVLAEHHINCERLEAVDWGHYIAHHMTGPVHSFSRFLRDDRGHPGHYSVSLHAVTEVRIERFSISGGSGGVKLTGKSRGESFTINLWDS